MKISGGNLPEEEIEYEKKLALQEQNRKKLEQEALQKIKNDKIQKKKEHEQALKNQRLELIKQKQGITNENEIIQEEKIVVEKPKGFKAIENFFYLNKTYIILGTIVAIIASFLIYDIATKVKPDINIVVLPSNGISEKIPELEALFETYTDDINGDGKIKVSIKHIPIANETDQSKDVSNVLKLEGEIESCSTMIYISDEKCDNENWPAYMLEKLGTENPGNPNFTEYGFKLDSDKLKEALNWEDMPDDMYIGIRYPENGPEKNIKELNKEYAISKEVLDKFIADFNE